MGRRGLAYFLPAVAAPVPIQVLWFMTAAVCLPCTADAEHPSGDDAYWEDLRRQGLRSSLVRGAPGRSLEDVVPAAAAGAGEEAEYGEGGARDEAATARLSRAVLYGRPVLRVPEQLLISPDTVVDAQARAELQAVLAAAPAEKRDMLGLVLALLLEHGRGDSRHRGWIDSVMSEELPPALNLTDRQLAAIAGTTAADAYRKILDEVELAEVSLSGLQVLADGLPDPKDLRRALGAVFRHALLVAPDEAEGGIWGAPARPVLVPLPDLLGMPRHPDLAVAAPLERGSYSAPGAPPGAGARAVLLLRARRDMPAGEVALPLWLGLLSNSELILRRGVGYPRNPNGIGGNLTLPPNWSPNQNTPNFQEYRRFNCSSPEAFEMRFSVTGWPRRSYIRCARVAHHLKVGSYDRNFVNRTASLDKWPPPRKYAVDDWLPWTQGDQQINNAIHSYCVNMKKQLKETISTATAEDFRKSTDPVDVLLWRLRSDEARTFRECVALSRSVSVNKD